MNTTPVESVVIPRVLSIAGTDPTGGAGLQADLKSIAANGGYGMGVVTALVAQNTCGVRAIHVPPPEFLVEQLNAVSDDVVIDAVKIGMLFDVAVVEAVRAWLDRVRPSCVVLDPVMVATSGDRLLAGDAEAAVIGLLAAVDLVTPNTAELAVLVGEPEASTWPEVLAQAQRLSQRSGVKVLAKGGHLAGPMAPDAFVDQAGVVEEFEVERVDTPHTHGTGCSLSAAVATWRPQVNDWPVAIGRAKNWLTESLRAGDRLHVGQGHGPISHLAGLWARGGTLPDPTMAAVAATWWSDVSDIRAAIDRLRFVQELGAGTLDRSAFTSYLAQDALYLRDYARALAAAAALAPTPAEQAFWSASAHGAIATELDLHASWLPTGTLFDTPPGPATTAYVNHLLGLVARGNYADLSAGLLPCYWIYVDVGSRLVVRAGAGHPYADWIATYADPDFEALTQQAVDIVTGLAARVSAPQRRSMAAAFRASTQHEWAFFAAPLAEAPDPSGGVPR
jgi:hydroxymethylpyrimidine kinase/phosphomethylpyrimidine kinase